MAAMSFSAKKIRELRISAEEVDYSKQLTTMDGSLFVRPRPKKPLLPPPSKKRRTNNSAIEEISFDFEARADYLTGFHKRKVQRAKAAQEQAAKLAKEERIKMRKQVGLSDGPFGGHAN